MRVRDEYRAVVAKAAGVTEEDLQFGLDEGVRRRRDGKTPMIDFPRLRSIGSVTRALDTRICIALCTDKLSSKVWSRVGLPMSGDSWSFDEIMGLRQLTSSFRKISRASAAWAFEMLREELRRHFPRLRLRRKGRLEISTLGTNDHKLTPYLRQFAVRETTSNEVLAEAETNGKLSRYFQDILDIDYPLGELAEREPDSFWFTLPMTIELDNGIIESREVLYLMRPTPDVAQVVGLGFDDSSDRRLAQEAALKLSRWIANRV